MTSSIERVREALHFIPASDRDTWVKMGMAVKSEIGETGYAMWEEWSRQDESFDSKAAQDAWKSFHSSGKVTAGSLFHEAKAHGWRDDGAYQTPVPEQIAERVRISAERAAREEAVKASERAEAAKKAAAILNDSKPAPDDHPYLSGKAIKANGAKLHHDALVIPMRADGQIHSLQFIAPDGKKRFLTGGRVMGCYFSVGTMKGAEALCIAEGFATGATIHEATDYPVAVAFNAGNLGLVAKAMREKFPDLPLILCADDDSHTKGNPGLTKATAAALAVGGILAIPFFGRDPS